MTRAKNSTYISISLSNDEKDQLDAAVAAAGIPRNRFLRNFIRTLNPKDWVTPKDQRKP